jgi:polysaccharide export outer membrane protein
MRHAALLAAIVHAVTCSVSAQGGAVRPATTAAQSVPTIAAAAVPGDYIIGPEDQLTVMFWREKDLSADVIVRPDGKISLPLLNEVHAAGLTPDQLREKVTDLAKRFVEDPNATIVVRQINSRKVFINGQVEKPGPYPLMSPTTVLQLISTAGGLREYAKRSKIVIIRTDEGRPVSLPFNYDDVMNRKNLKQNVQLKPGDVVLVP